MAHGSSVLAFLVTEGSTVILPCHYSVKHHGLSHVCWGRDCGTFWCNDIIIQTDEYGVISKVSDSSNNSASNNHDPNYYRTTGDTDSFSKEPRHIIYEIRTRRPVEENIYTLE
ncbi:hypothetical protein cypCar_00039250 [Cyprinus carpio]|nr:hypothetical protein cypCar_00039250 [Cyprinus carpio]